MYEISWILTIKTRNDINTNIDRLFIFFIFFQEV